MLALLGLPDVPAKMQADCCALGHLDSWLHCNARPAACCTFTSKVCKNSGPLVLT